MNRAARGAAAHQAGLAAEEAAARRYEAAGGEIVARRWRAKGAGEIDLIVRMGGAVVFVEVKAGAAARARNSISARQWARLEAAALRYMVERQTGETVLRFDAAFVGPDGAVEVVENARSFDEW